MSEIVAGTGPIVRPILDKQPSPAAPAPVTTPQTLRGPVQLCVNEGDTCDGKLSPGYCGPPWMRRVVVRITPRFSGGRPISALDATGQALHCVWRFPCPRTLRECVSRQGILRIGGWSPGYQDREPVFVESNGGTFRIPRGVQLFFGGGALGTEWDVDVQELLDHNWGKPARFWLDTLSTSAGTRILYPMEHTVIQPLTGTLTINGVAVTTAGSSPVISLAQPDIVAGANSLYRTGVVEL